MTTTNRTPATAAERRVVFDFDQTALDRLDEMRRHFGVKTHGEALYECLKFCQIVRDFGERGFDRIIFENTETGQLDSRLNGFWTHHGGKHEHQD